ncbi:MAG: hypothetical protein GY827_00675 [Cytophagales bacterium]|nr:hypothetical protein [Cytophagales bacterium]
MLLSVFPKTITPDSAFGPLSKLEGKSKFISPLKNVLVISESVGGKPISDSLGTLSGPEQLI